MIEYTGMAGVGGEVGVGAGRGRRGRRGHINIKTLIPDIESSVAANLGGWEGSRALVCTSLAVSLSSYINCK